MQHYKAEKIIELLYLHCFSSYFNLVPIYHDNGFTIIHKSQYMAHLVLSCFNNNLYTYDWAYNSKEKLVIAGKVLLTDLDFDLVIKLKKIIDVV